MNSVLITGGSGYFGQAFARAALEHGAARVCIYSRDEHKQAAMREESNDERLRFFIGDVRDLPRLRQAMEGCDLVTHAAALKRIEVGHYNPCEMVKTNIGGAINVIDAAVSAGVAKVVALSTDKAYQPVSAYGQTKALAETLFLNANNVHGERGPRFAVTRYGNVAGSSGSVIERWRATLKLGDTVQVTDPEATRFWMTIEEAVGLVLDTVRTMEGGELAIPSLPAFRVADLAEAMGAKMNVIGLKPWEKVHESMRSDLCSADAPRLSVADLRERLEHV